MLKIEFDPSFLTRPPWWIQPFHSSSSLHPCSCSLYFDWSANGKNIVCTDPFKLIGKRQAIVLTEHCGKNTEGQQLPPNLIAWRDPEEYNGLYLKLWSNLEDFFCRRGFTLWRPWHPQETTLCPPDDKHPVPDGFLYTAPCREEDSLKSLGYFPQKVVPLPLLWH